MRGFIYVIAAGDGRCKIGRARDPKARLQTLQCGVPDELRLAYAVEVGAMVRAEAAAHQRFQDRRHRGEWFAITEAEAADALDQIAQRYPVEHTLRTGTTSDLSPAELSLLLANVAGRYRVMSQASGVEDLPFPAEAVIMDAAMRILSAEDDLRYGQRGFNLTSPTASTSHEDEEDGSL